MPQRKRYRGRSRSRSTSSARSSDRSSSSRDSSKRRSRASRTAKRKRVSISVSSHTSSGYSRSSRSSVSSSSSCSSCSTNSSCSRQSPVQEKNRKSASNAKKRLSTELEPLKVQLSNGKHTVLSEKLTKKERADTTQPEPHQFEVAFVHKFPEKTRWTTEFLSDRIKSEPHESVNALRVDTQITLRRNDSGDWCSVVQPKGGRADETNASKRSKTEFDSSTDYPELVSSLHRLPKSSVKFRSIFDREEIRRSNCDQSIEKDTAQIPEKSTSIKAKVVQSESLAPAPVLAVGLTSEKINEIRAKFSRIRRLNEVEKQKPEATKVIEKRAEDGDGSVKLDQQPTNVKTSDNSKPVEPPSSAENHKFDEARKREEKVKLETGNNERHQAVKDTRNRQQEQKPVEQPKRDETVAFVINRKRKHKDEASNKKPIVETSVMSSDCERPPRKQTDQDADSRRLNGSHIVDSSNKDIRANGRSAINPDNEQRLAASRWSNRDTIDSKHKDAEPASNAQDIESENDRAQSGHADDSSSHRRRKFTEQRPARRPSDDYSASKQPLSSGVDNGRKRSRSRSRSRSIHRERAPRRHFDNEREYQEVRATRFENTDTYDRSRNRRFNDRQTSKSGAPVSRRGAGAKYGRMQQSNRDGRPVSSWKHDRFDDRDDPDRTGHRPKFSGPRRLVATTRSHSNNHVAARFLDRDFDESESFGGRSRFAYGRRSRADIDGEWRHDKFNADAAQSP